MAANIPFTDERPKPATRTRLGSGVLLTCEKELICECTLYDLAESGVGIVLPDAGLELPEQVILLDNRDMTRAATRIRWRAGAHLTGAYLERPISLHATSRQ